MKNKKMIIISLLLLVITLTVLIAEEHKQHCGQHFPKSNQATLIENISGTVQVVENKLQLVQDSTNVTFNLVIPENLEKEMENIQVGKRYIFSGKNNNSGFVVDKFVIIDTEQASNKPQVNSARCIGCRLCVNQCPEGAISMVKGKAVIDQDKCIDCGVCIDGNGHFKGCPVKAIEKK